MEGRDYEVDSRRAIWDDPRNTRRIATAVSRVSARFDMFAQMVDK